MAKSFKVVGTGRVVTGEEDTYKPKSFKVTGTGEVYNGTGTKIQTIPQSNNSSPVSHPGGNNAVSMASADLGAGRAALPKATQTQFGLGFNKTVTKPQPLPYAVSSFMPQVETTSANIKTNNQYLNNGLPLGVVDPVSAQTYKDKATLLKEQIAEQQKNLNPYKGVSSSLMAATYTKPVANVPKGVSSFMAPTTTVAKPAQQVAEEQRVAALKGELAQAQNAGYMADYSQQWIALSQRPDAEAIKQNLARMATLKASFGTDYGQNVAAMNEYQRIRGSLDKLGINAEGLADWLQRNADYLEAAQEVKEAQEFATERPVLASIKSIGQNLVSGQGGLQGIAQQGMNTNSGEYRPINIYGDAFDASRAKTTIRGTVGENIAKNHGQAAKFLYDIGMSMGDSGVVALTGGLTGLGGAASVILGSAVASDTMMNVVERGGSTEQAVTAGVLAGVAEAVFEKVSLDKFLDKLKNTNAIGIKAHLKNMGLQALTEASEEALTELANIFTDEAVMGSLSELNEMRKNGASESAINWEIAKRVGLAALGGALSGGVFGGVGSISNRTSTTLRENRAIKALNEKYGTTVNIKNSLGKANANAQYTGSEDKIDISVKSDNNVAKNVSHEVSHAIKAKNAAEWNKLYEIANANLSEDARSKLEYVLQKTGYTDADMQEEVVAHYVQECIADISKLEELVGIDRNLAQKIVDALDEIVRKVTNQRKIGYDNSEDSKKLREIMGDITPEQAQQTLEQMKKALAAGVEAASSVAPNGSDIKHSLGYHAGDLGKAESYAQQGYGRGTGHFGTGTYFVGDESKINDTYYGKRPHHAVEFDNYNLHKIRSDKEGYDLHDQLRAIDGGFSQEFLDAAKAGKFRVSELRNTAWERAEGYETEVWDDELEMFVKSDFFEANIRAFTEVAKENGIEIQTYDEWLAKQSPDDIPKPGDSDYDYWKRDYLHYLGETLDSVDNKKNDGYDRFRDAYFKLWLRFGTENVNRALQNVVEYDAKMDASDYNTQRKSDSLATVFMKSLGYEGIDARGTGLDNTKYGSVIYDLKGEDAKRKAEIGTAKYSLKLSDSDYLDAVNRGDGKNKDVKYSLSSIANTFFEDENMSADEFEKADYKQTQGYKDYVDSCLNNYKQTRRDFDETVAKREIEEAIDGIVRVAIAAKKAGYDIYDDATKRNKKDSKDRLLFSSLEPNSDYFTSSDISTICDKRKNFAEIYDDIVRAEEAKGVPQGKRFFDNVDNYFYLHKLMADKGLTQPCRQCYVESMRKNLAPMASAFLRLVRETNPNNLANDQLYQQKGKNKGAPKTNNTNLRARVLESLAEYDMTVNDLTIETLTTEDGLAHLKITAPNVYEAFNSFYGQSKPKMPKSATPFRFGELTALLTDEHGRIKKSLVDKINSTGGFRLQSYSDFQIQNYTDVLQVIFEAGTLGLNGHAYTKVPAFLEATEGTNLKRNISIFMYKDGDEWKLDKNDSFPYDLEEIYDIVRADKSGNTGIIAVSQNEDMSAWIMANDMVGYGIPFHKSGLKMGVVRDTIVREGGREIKGYSGTKDHTKQQTEVWAKASDDHKALTKVKSGINIYRFWDFDNKSNLSKQELIEKNVKKYIDACNEAGYLPKFREYVMNNGKVLNKVLEYSKQLGYVSENATIEDISFEYSGYRIPYGYYKFLGDFGMFTPDGQASPHDVLSLENYDFDKAVKFFEDSEALRRNEILQQFANGEERQRYRDSDLTAEQLQEIVKQKRKEIAESVTNKKPTADADIHRSRKLNQEALQEMVDWKRAGLPYAPGYVPKQQPQQLPYAPGYKAANSPVQAVLPRAEELNREQQKPASMLNNQAVGIVASPELFEAMQSVVDYTTPKPNPEGSRSFDGSVLDNLGQGQAAFNTLDELLAQSKEDAAKRPADKEGIANVLTERPKKGVKENIEIAADFAARKLIDSGHTINTIAKAVDDKVLYPLYNNAKQSRQAAEYMIGDAQTDINGKRVGDSLVSIFDPIKSKGEDYFRDFSTYLYHVHNVDRMSLETNGAQVYQDAIMQLEMENPMLQNATREEVEALASGNSDYREAAIEWLQLDDSLNDLHNKPVFGESVTAEDSHKAATELLRKNPEFRELAEKVYAYNRNLMKYRVDAGLVSQKQADIMNALYPHYVPTFRDTSSTTGMKMGGNQAQVARTVRSATGSNLDLMPVDGSMAEQTLQTVRAAKMNIFGARLLEDALKHQDKVGRHIRSVVDKYNSYDMDEPPQYTGGVTIYSAGKPVSMDADVGVMEAFKSIQPDPLEGSNIYRRIVEANNTFKALVTGANPMFLAKNFARDLQDAGLYAGDLKDFSKNYPKAWKEIKNNGELWQLYKSQGGTGSSYFDYEKGLVDNKRKGVGKVFDKVEAANMMVEQAPRFTEFMSVLEKEGRTYEGIQKAMLAAADVTVNFGRSGTLTKTLNKTFVPFLNPSVQGADKFVRRFAQTKGAKEWLDLIGRCALLGIVPGLLNELLHRGTEEEEEYEMLNDRDKETNYVFSIGDGVWVKIPKGRAVSIFGSTAQRTARMAKGKEDAWAGFIELALDQVGSTDPFTGHILSSYLNTELFNPESPGKTWYGGDIEPQRLQGLPPGERYDEKTDNLSKWLGKQLNISPKKINHLLDSYTGVIGDFALPLMTPRAERNPFAAAFSIDSTTSNKLQGEFYDKLDELEQNKNSANPDAGTDLAYSYLSGVSREVSELNKQIRAIEADETIKDKEKREQTRKLARDRNTLIQKAMEDLPKYTEAAGAYKGNPDDAKREVNRQVFGAEYALKKYDKNVYEKAQKANAKGVSYEDYYKYRFSVDANGDGSVNQEEAKAALDKSNLTNAQKAYMWKLQNKSWKTNPYE